MENYEEHMQKEQGFRSKFLWAMLIVLLMVITAAAVVLISSGIRQNKYNSVLKRANNYYTAGDYQNAIAEYEKAIKIDKKKESAYLNLSSSYIAIGNYELALETINRALSLIASNKLETKKAEIQYLKDSLNSVEELTEEEIATYSAQASLENNVFDMIANYTFTEYFRDFGNVNGILKDNKIEYNYVNGGFTAIYYDLEKEKVVDTAKNVPYANVKPVELSYHDLTRVFYTSSKTFIVSYARLQELFGECLEFFREEQTGMYYVTAEYKGCRLSVETDSKGNIVDEYAWNKIEPLKRSHFETDEEVDGEIKGYVQDAMNGKGMKATMKVRERGKKKGPVITELTSGKDGSYSYGGIQGSYTIEVSAKGYITEYLDVEVIRGQIKTGKNVILSPEVGEGEIRIVLTWGSSPVDLDSYAIGKSSSGANFNINFRNKNETDIGNLDVDDTSSYGPETITITDVGASFEYSVVDFRSEGTMGGTEAKVKVYLPGKSSAVEYKVPSGSGILWKVFRYEDGELKKINQLTWDIDASSYHKGG